MINYEKEYKNSRNVCGEPFPEIVEFFENYDDECDTAKYFTSYPFFSAQAKVESKK